jgi:protein involved in ribonucleotide reduction
MDKEKLAKLIAQADLSNDASKQSFIEQLEQEHKAEMEPIVQKSKVLEEKLLHLTSKTQEILRNKPQDDKLLELELVRLATENNAYSPKQVYQLLKDRVSKQGDTFVIVQDNKQLPLDVYVKDFLAQPENENLIVSSAKSGTASFNQPYSRMKKRIKYTDQDERLADLAGLSIEDYLEVKQLEHSKIGRYRK